MEMYDKHIAIISSILSIVASCIAILGGVKHNIFLIILGILITLVFVFLFIRIRKKPKYTDIEGIRIEEADNIPLFASRKNKLNPLIVTHVCEICDSDAILEYEYFGICVDRKGMDKFSTCSYSHDINDLNDMNWFAYDLKNDPKRNHKIKPQLQTPKGATKRVVFNFHRRIRFNEICHFYTYQEVKNSVKRTGKDYFVSTVLYKNRPLYDYKVVLKFHDIKPSNISVYSVNDNQGVFLYELLDENMINENNTYIYTDYIEDETAWSIRVYIFNRE